MERVYLYISLILNFEIVQYSFRFSNSSTVLTFNFIQVFELEKKKLQEINDVSNSQIFFR